MDISIVIIAFSILLQGVIGYEIGDLTVNALNYTTTRGQALRDGFVILICIVFRFLLDKWLIGSKKNIGISRIVLDIVAFVLGTIVLLISLEMLAGGNVPMPLVIMLMVLVFTVLYEKDIYLTEGTVELNEPDPYGVDEEVEDDLGIELEVVSNSTGEKIESNENNSDDDEDDEVDLDNAPADINDIRVFAAEVVKLLSCIATVMVGVLALVDVHAEKYSPVYYLLIALMAVLAIVLKALSRGMDALIKEPDKKAQFIGFSVTVVVVTVYICFKSILVGLVFLLGAYLVKLIVPLAMNYWGTGGTKLVKINIDLLSRFVARVFVLIIALLVVWLLSYGAIWEKDYLIIIAIAFGMQELLMEQNMVKIDTKPEEEYDKMDS